MKLEYKEFRDLVRSMNDYFYAQTRDWDMVTSKVGFLLADNVTAEVNDELYEKFTAYVEAKKGLNELITSVFESRRKQEPKEPQEEPIIGAVKGGRKRAGKVHSRGD